MHNFSKKESVSGVYYIKCLTSNMYYIGSSKNIYRRFVTHKSALKNNKHYNLHLQRIYNKYGEENFQSLIIEYVPEIELIEKEEYWINFYDAYKNGFNQQPHALRQSGYTMSEETKIKIGNSNRGRKYSEEIIAKKRGLRLSQETKDKISKKLKGIKPTEYCRLMSCIKVFQLTKDKRILIREFESIKEAGTILNIDPSSISGVCKKKKHYNSAGGFNFVYKNPETIKEYLMTST